MGRRLARRGGRRRRVASEVEGDHHHDRVHQDGRDGRASAARQQEETVGRGHDDRDATADAPTGEAEGLREGSRRGGGRRRGHGRGRAKDPLNFIDGGLEERSDHTAHA